MRERHGDYKTRLYGIWIGMKNRYLNPNNSSYNLYGERGITVCKEWQDSYLSFKKWSIENNYCDKLQLDRIDNSKGYSPKNCRWVTPKENANNTRKNLHLNYNGKLYNTEEIANMAGITRNNVLLRLNRGWSVEKILKTPTTKATTFCVNGKQMTIKEIADKLNVNYLRIYKRLKRGQEIDFIIKELNYGCKI